MDINELLLKVKAGEISVDEAEKYLKYKPYDDIDFAKLDTHRKLRQGFAEVVFCEGKSDGRLTEIYKKIYEENGEVLGTRASRRQYEAVSSVIPDIIYDEESRILMIEKEDKKHIGKVTVCTAGTADIPVAGEAALTASFLGANVEKIYDVGVSGIHRLLDRTEDMQDSNCVIAVAGMEGALASVVGGLVSCPVIAVPTSIGYGANMGGVAALLAMINSCANGIATVNIDNGYGAGYMAAIINRQSCR